jgi:hypothetical protein
VRLSRRRRREAHGRPTAECSVAQYGITQYNITRCNVACPAQIAPDPDIVVHLSMIDAASPWINIATGRHPASFLSCNIKMRKNQQFTAQERARGAECIQI